MYFVLGALAAGLLALTVTPAIWRRANRLSFARIESAMPMSPAEIRAEKDHLRAEFAITTRRLEAALARLNERDAIHVIDTNRKRDEIVRLQAEQEARGETLRQLEARVGRLGEEVRASEERLHEAHAELAERNQRIAERGAAIASLEAELVAAMQLSEEEKLERVARDTEIGNLRDEVAARRAAEAALAIARDEFAAELAAERLKLAREQHNGGELLARIAALEAERADRIAALDRRSIEMREREAELGRERSRGEALQTAMARMEAERGERLAELARLTADVERLKGELTEAVAERRSLRERLAAAEREVASERIAAERRAEEQRLFSGAPAAQARPAGEGGRAVVALRSDGEAAVPVAAGGRDDAPLAVRLAELEDDYAVLLAENAELRRVAGADWENERMENARLRERLTTIAADVARLTQTTRPVALPAIEDVNGAGNGNGALHKAAPRPLRPPPEAPPVGGEVSPAGKTLAERIRALQHAAARH